MATLLSFEEREELRLLCLQLLLFKLVFLKLIFYLLEAVSLFHQFISRLPIRFLQFEDVEPLCLQLTSNHLFLLALFKQLFCQLL
jgi:hypothetical protein